MTGRTKFLLTALTASAAVFSAPAWSQTKPDTETPRVEKSQSRAMIQQLLKEGKIMRSSDAKRGMRGIGRSVFQGTKIEEFKIEVIGTLKKVMGGGDLVLIKVLDGPVVKRQSGIIAGMSGSPVYINGKMLGAIAIGFGFPKEPIGGVTPITQMIEGALPDNSATHVARGPHPTRPEGTRLSQFAARERGVAALNWPQKAKLNQISGSLLPSPAQRIGRGGCPLGGWGEGAVYRPTAPLTVAGRKISRVIVSRDTKRLALSGSTMTMRPATMLMQVSGFSPQSLPRVKEMLAPWGIEPILGSGGGMMNRVQALSTASEKTDVNPPFVPGGAIGVPLVTGDMDMSGVGTITFRWGKRILAFGHPMFGKGAVSIPMTSAYIHDIFPSYQQSFKLASPVREVGALQQDTEFAIGGTIGRRADMVPMRVQVRNAERQINRTYNVRLIKDPLFTPLLIQMVGAETLSGALGMDSDKMVRVAFRMDVEGAPPIVRNDYIYAQSDVSMPALGDLFEAVMLTQMNPFSRADIKNISLDVTLEPVRHTARIKRITADRNRAKAGDTVRVNVLLEPHETPDQYITRVFNFTIPADSPDGALRISVGPASDFWTGQTRVGGAPPKPNNLKELLEAYAQAGPSNELLVQASTPNTFLMVGRQKVSNPPPSWASLVPPRASTSIGAYNETQTQREKLNYSLSGSQFLSIPVESARHSDRQRPDNGSTDSAKPGASTPSFSTAMDNADEAAFDPSEFEDGGDELAARRLGSPAWMQRVQRNPAFGPYMKTWWKSATRGANFAAGDTALPPVGPELPLPAPITPSIVPVKPKTVPDDKPDAGASATPTATPEPNGNLARPVSKWVQQDAAAFGKGTFEGAAVSSDGSIRPAPVAKLLAATTQPVAWSVATRGGITYIGVGHEARIFRVDGQGSITQIYASSEVAVTSLTTDERGNLYAGVAPGGKVLRFANGGDTPTTIFDGKETFIWALEWDEKGRLLVATGGQKGALYRLGEAATRAANDAENTPLAIVPQKHIRALSVRGSDIFAGTADDGVLYQISDNGALRALYEAGGNAPSAAMVMPGERPDMSSLMMAQRMMMGGGGPMMMGGDAMMLMAGAESNSLSGGALRAQGVEITSVAASPEGVYFGTSNSGAIYRWTPENGAAPIFNAPARAVYALRRGLDGKIYAAVAGSGAGGAAALSGSGAITSAMLPTGGGGAKGAVYEITPAANGASAGDSRALRLIETTQPQIVALGLNGSDLVAATANNAAVYRVANGTASSGTYTSNVLDAGRIVRWGALRALSDRAQIETRSGNTQEPDATWSDWQNAGNNNEARVASPSARYLQYRARLDTGGTLSRVEVIYRPQNQAPTVAFTAPTGGEFLKDKKKISWTGKDPDADTLRYRLWLSRDNGANWQSVELKKTDATSYEIEGKKWADGDYRAKIEASDANRNPEDPRSDDATSRAFTIDSTAPKLDGQTAQKQDNSWKLRAVVSDALSPIAGAEWRVFVPKPEKPAKKDAAKTEAKADAKDEGKKDTAKDAKTDAKADAKAADAKASATDAADVDDPDSANADETDDTDSTVEKPKEAEWRALAAADGIFDGRREELVGLVEATTAPLEIKSGTQIEIRARDAAGNSVTVMVTLP